VEWYDVQRGTIYSCLKGLVTDGLLERAVADILRPERRKAIKKSSKDQWTDYLTELGTDAQAWTAALVQQYLAETQNVESWISSCRRSLKEVGLRYKNHALQSPSLGLRNKNQSARNSKKR